MDDLCNQQNVKLKIESYIDRLGYTGPLKVDEATLIGLHDHHVRTVPFEDLDIHIGQPLSLDYRCLYEKVVINRRGGFCYELNSLFYILLKNIGFDCHMVSARIYEEEDELSAPFDHMSLLVYLDSTWLIDVGYGNLFVKPIKLFENTVVQGHSKYFKINRLDDNLYLLRESLDGIHFSNRYQFDTTPRHISEFEEQCILKQTSPDSYFVKNLICTLPINNGRKTIMNDTYSFRKGNSKTEKQIKSNKQLHRVLKEEFDIHLNWDKNLTKPFNSFK